jgi:hypothetical protein
MKRINRILFILYFGLIGLFAYSTVYAQPLAGAGTTASKAAVPSVTLPMREGSLRLAVFGDAGRGSKQQYDLGGVMEDYRQAFRFDWVLLTGDNIYGKDAPAHMKNKFELPYKSLLENGA